MIDYPALVEFVEHMIGACAKNPSQERQKQPSMQGANDNGLPALVRFKQLYKWRLEPTWAHTTLVPGALFELTVSQTEGPGRARSGMKMFQGALVTAFEDFQPRISVPPGRTQARVWFGLTDGQNHLFAGGCRFCEIRANGTINTVDLLEDATGSPWAVLRFKAFLPDDAPMRQAHVYSLLVGAYSLRVEGRSRQYLRGPYNDVGLINNIMSSRIHTRVGDKATLVGDDATLQNISANLEHMANEAQRGDVVFFYFSGLGTTSRELYSDLGAHERPGACLVPYDVYPQNEGDGYRLLSTRDVARKLNPAMLRGATVVLVLDCSFSKNHHLNLHDFDANATVKYLQLECSLNQHEFHESEGAIDSFEHVVETINNANRGIVDLDRSARSVGAGDRPAESACVGSVLDTLLVGAQQSAGAAAGECGRWGVIARGAQGFGAGIVEAASKATATRDVGAGERKAALDALGAVTGEQWAAVAAKAIALDPRGMRALVDRATGGLGASDSRRRQLLRRVSDSALSLLMGAAGDREKLHEAVQELPLQRKMELLEEAGQETGEVVARPWVRVLSAMLAEAPDATRAAVSAEVVRHGLGDSRLRGMLEDIAVRGMAEAVSAISDAAGTAGLRLRQETIERVEKLKAKAETGLMGQQARKSVLDVLASVADECRSVLPTVAAKLGMQSGTLGDLLAIASVGLAEEMLLGVWDSPVSFRSVLHDSPLTGQMRDPQIEVVQRSSARSQPSSTSMIPTDGNLCGLDSVHAFATVRAVLDAAERVLRRIVGAGCKEDLWQELPEPLDDGLWGGDGGADRGLRWQVGKTLRVDTRAAGVLEPLYSRSAGGLLFPARGTEGGVGAAPASRGVEVVAHTAGYALLDALRPGWAEGVRERPEGGVLHEALADLVALLVPLGSPAVGGAVAAQTRCDVRAAGVAKRMARALADAVGGSAVRSASSTLTARDVWDVVTGQMKKTGSGRLWSSRELSGMITSAVYGAVASELLRRCHGSETAGRGRKESAKFGGAAEDPAEVLSQLAKQALRVLIEACLEQRKDKAAPTLVEFCESLVKGMQSHEGDDLSLLPGSVEHTTATLQRSTTNKLQLSALKEQPTLTRAARVDATGPAVRMCECIARVGSEAATAVECPASRELWAMLCSGALKAVAVARGDNVAAWERLGGTWGAMERRAAGQRDFVDKRMWRAIVVEAAEEQTAEGCKASVEKMVLSLEYVTGCCKESASLRLWRKILVAYRTAV
eukprot:m51a1_g10567 hypothetical protein (1243) ;mRNA; f:34094-40343